ncbi:hypothetical protein PS2_023352 [Malus domestica]
MKKEREEDLTSNPSQGGSSGLMATEIPAIDLKRCLLSLACVKGKNVLRKEPMSKDIVRRMPSCLMTSSQASSSRVEEDRKPQIEAAIVRIMKSRRVLDHNNIVGEVTKQLHGRFLPNPVVIKKRIVIEREFLERDKTDRKLYRYLA